MKEIKTPEQKKAARQEMERRYPPATNAHGSKLYEWLISRTNTRGASR